MTTDQQQAWGANVALSEKMTRLGTPDIYINVKASTILAVSADLERLRKAFIVAVGDKSPFAKQALGIKG